MNERIKELAEQADLYARSDNSSMLFENYQKRYTEKFAELIVKECFGCIDIMEKIAESNNSSIPKDYDKHTYLETLDTLRGLLKTHFGVDQ